MRVRLSCRLLVLASAVALVGACSTSTPTSTATATDSTALTPNSGAVSDCLSPLLFSTGTYALLLGRDVRTVTPGRSLGKGQIAACSDGGGTAPAGIREVYSLPGVPPEQSVLLLGPTDRGSVFVITRPPATGWDDDLLTLARTWSARLP